MKAQKDIKWLNNTRRHGINTSHIPIVMAPLGMLVVEGGWLAVPEEGVSEENIKYQMKVTGID